MDVPRTQTVILLFALLLCSVEDLLHLVLGQPQSPLQLRPVEESLKKVHPKIRTFVITEKAPTRAFSWLKGSLTQLS